MAGQKKKRLDLEVLESIPVDHIVTMFEAGKSMTRICMDLGIGRRALEIWCETEPNADRITLARARAADNLACETLEIADSAAIEESNLARVRILTRQWLAEKWKPSVYAQQKGAAVNINIQGMRMDALRHVEVLEDLSTPKLST